MGGLLQKYEIGEAAVRCLQAGCDLILCRSESPVTKHIIQMVIDAVKDGRYTEKQLDESVQRVLGMRFDMGLAENGGKVDALKAGDMFENKLIKNTAEEAAEKSVTVLRNNKNILPLGKDKKVLLIEQIHHFHSFVNNMYSHPGMLWEEMRRRTDNVAVTLINETYTEADKAAVMQRIREDDFDIIVATSYYNYRTHANMIEFINELKEFNKPIVLVSNTPYEKFSIPADIETAIVCFCPSGRENISVVADKLLRL
jgi:beta-glucosidase-like glycosyl hydrolase